MAKEQALCKGKKYNSYNSSNPWVACGNKAKTEAGYCKVHDPEIIKDKARVKEDIWKKEYEERQSKRDSEQRKREAGEEAIEILKKITTTDSVSLETAKFFEKYGGI